MVATTENTRALVAKHLRDGRVERKPMTLRVPLKTFNQIKKIAKESDTSLANVANLIVEIGLEHFLIAQREIDDEAARRSTNS